MKDIRQKLLATFQIEHREHVEQIRSLLALIEKTSGPASGAEFDEAFRHAHSLKGAARAVDLHGVEGLAHQLETLFSRVRRGVLPLDGNVARVVQQVLDASEDCVSGLAENRSVPGLEPALHAIERLLALEPEASEAKKPQAMEAAPPETSTPFPGFQAIETVRITARNFDGLLRSATGLLAESQYKDQVADRLNGIASQLAGMQKEAEYVHRVTAIPLRQLRMAPEFSRVSSYLNSMERQVRSLSRQMGDARQLQQRRSWTMRHLGKQFEQDIWQARMAPADDLLEGYRKMVRDLARDEAKEIEFRATSSGVQADRRVLDALKDPLRHMLRNAVSHGIEKPVERAAKGKSPTGLVTLRIDTQGHRLTVTIQDDGRGVDISRVAEVAVGAGLLSEPDVARSTPEELARLLFRAGFSTARAVSDLSGRGMGLSVVYEAVRRLQGEVELRPAEKYGTSIYLSVPLSISTHRLLLMICGTQPFAIPIHAVERLHSIRRDSIQTVEGKPVVMIEDKPLPLLSLGHLLNLEQTCIGVQQTSTQQAVLSVMILRSGGKRAAVAVDRFLSEAETVIQDLGPTTARDRKISGGILLENGDVAFVLNPMELLETSVHRELQTFLKPAEPLRESRSILVVDDSITTRTLEKSILEAHGYRVRVAVDGVEALERLRAELPDLIISDVQMPRLDGFGLLEAIKKDPAFAHLPVIMVTSLEQAEDQRRGLSLGADAYIVKRKFDQGDLLATIRQIL